MSAADVEHRLQKLRTADCANVVAAVDHGDLRLAKHALHSRDEMEFPGGLTASINECDGHPGLQPAPPR